MDVGAGVGRAGDAASYGVHYSEHHRTSFGSHLYSGKGVSGFTALGYGEEDNNVLEALNKGLRSLYKEKEEILLSVSAEIIVNAVMKNRDKEAILPILTKVLG